MSCSPVLPWPCLRPAPRTTRSPSRASGTYPGLSHEHVPWDVTYSPEPPVGGPHYERWLRCDLYDEPVPDELAVHSMEHGAVWVTYRPDLPAADLATLRELQRINGRYFLLSPYPGLPSPVVASTWGLQLAVDRADDPRLAEFTRRYAGGDQGGEPGVGCVNGVPPGAVPSLSPSPS